MAAITSRVQKLCQTEQLANASTTRKKHYREKQVLEKSPAHLEVEVGQEMMNEVP